jgi:probable HAF family extracellular repeat protein
MKLLTLLRPLALLVIVALVGVAGLGGGSAKAGGAAPTYSLLDLGLVPKATTAWGVSLSQKGNNVAVESNAPQIHERAARYHNGSLKSLGTLGGGRSTAMDVNNTGVEVGNSLDAAAASRAFVYQNGVISELPDLGGDASGANALNDHGVIVGLAAVPGGSDPRAVEWVNGQLSVLPGLGAASNAQANAVNEAGDVVGSSWSATNLLPQHAVMWKGGQVIDLIPQQQVVGNEAHAISNNDAVVGDTCATSTAPCTDGGWLWDDGVVASDPLGTGGASSNAESINNHWNVVGRGQDPTGTWFPWLFFNGQIYNLNNLLAAGASGWTITNAAHINNLGQIAATAISPSDGQAHAVLLTPTTTPAFDKTRPSGTATLDGGASTTSNPTVQVVAPGTDASGVFAVRVSNSSTVGVDGRLTLGQTVAPSQASSTTPLSWSLTDPATGGTPGTGTHTVYVQWLDWAGNWSTPTSLSITLT